MGDLLLMKMRRSLLILLIHSVSVLMKRKSIYFEVRNYSNYNRYKYIYDKIGWKWMPYLNIRIYLQNKTLDDVLARMKYNRRREIKLTLTEQVYFREAKNSTEVEQLFNILRTLYREKVKLPLPNLSFFKTLFQSVIGKVFVVIQNKTIIGGSFCLYLENKGIYTMYYCGLRDYGKNIFPTHLSVLAAIDFGLNHKLEFLDLMGAGRSDEDYGVRKYKLEFGGELNEFGRYLIVNNNFFYYLGKFGLKVLGIFNKS